MTNANTHPTPLDDFVGDETLRAWLTVSPAHRHAALTPQHR